MRYYELYKSAGKTQQHPGWNSNQNGIHSWQKQDFLIDKLFRCLDVCRYCLL